MTSCPTSSYLPPCLLHPPKYLLWCCMCIECWCVYPPVYLPHTVQILKFATDSQSITTSGVCKYQHTGQVKSSHRGRHSMWNLYIIMVAEVA